MKKILALTALMLFGFAGQQAHAFGPDHTGFYIEPGALYAFKGNGKIGSPNPVTGAGDIAGDQSGWGGELRVGAHVHNIFFAGLQGTYLRDKLDTNGIDQTGNEWGAGVFAGVQMPWVLGLRVWGAYLPYAQYSFSDGNNFHPKFDDGRGYQVGAGIKIAILSLNFEYLHLDYNGSSGSSGDTTFDAGNPHYNHDAYMVGVSLPIDL